MDLCDYTIIIKHDYQGGKIDKILANFLVIVIMSWYINN